ncbi:MAG: hypothetical protein VYB44_10765 [Bacteroidota bacterium]|uniref:DUF4855 domain-containing protein n=1 Tax=Roseivirga thermotolerans TaxID=1758176 RepID=A0ABQ3I7Q5_9BACT|nr:hypothetical protein [Roseivirga thermotolerans]MEC7754501.1 hypothetical protein [Bacteroidota bacterium]GHE57987.1 hypothetical protein GCM10011340_11440 [Roseivirga thermotolerans]
MKKTFKFLLAGLVALALSCTEKEDIIPEIPVEDFPANFYDTASLTTILRKITDTIPSWEVLKRFTDKAERLPLPSFEKRALFWADPDGKENPFNDPQFDYMTNLMRHHAELVENFGANESSALFTSVPPFDGPNGGEIVVPYPLDILDAKLRATTVLFLREKELGLPTILVNFYPPFIDMPVFKTKAEFETWFADRYLPEKEAEAKAAELMKAEKYIPWPIEFELFITQVGGIYDDGFLAGATEDEILIFANEVKDRILSTVKTHYRGIVVAHLYTNYQMTERKFWNRMSYTGFDELEFAIFPPFDAETTNTYMDVQLENYQKIIENSGNLPWVASEVSVFEWYVEDGKFEEYEKAMYEATFNKLENASNPPRGISAAAGYMKTEAAKQYLKEYFSRH